MFTMPVISCNISLCKICDQNKGIFSGYQDPEFQLRLRKVDQEHSMHKQCGNLEKNFIGHFFSCGELQ